jgi:hypothetical protein
LFAEPVRPHEIENSRSAEVSTDDFGDQETHRLLRKLSCVINEYSQQGRSLVKGSSIAGYLKGSMHHVMGRPRANRLVISA